jgi:hypothetical protein
MMLRKRVVSTTVKPRAWLHFIVRYRVAALFCAFAMLVCELISRPFAEMGMSDDLAYVVTAHKLAETGHIVYVGAAAAMLGSQVALGAVLIKLFGFSFTTVRMGTLLLAMGMAFLLQRIMVRAGIREGNATIGTLAVVLSPLLLMLSVTYMSDVYGLFAVVVCLYCCMRALQAASSNAMIGWLCFAVLTNAFFGTARQVAWLGILVMVPSTLWLLRRQRRVVAVGSALTIAGALFVVGGMEWFRRQPYSLPAPLGGGHFPLAHALGQLAHNFLDIPFLLLPLVAIFLPEIRKSSRGVVVGICGVALAYALLAWHWRHSHADFLLEPTQALGGWVGIHGIHEGMHLQGTPPLFLHPAMQVLFTVLAVGGVLGMIASLLRGGELRADETGPHGLSWYALSVLLVPFAVSYTIFLVPSATRSLFDRYTLEPLAVLAIFLVRYYQDRIALRLPPVTVVLVSAMAVYGVATTHNTFAVYRARVAMAEELRQAGVPDTEVDNGFEYNFGVELQHANHINDPGIVIPAGAYVPPQPLPKGTCNMFWHEKTPHVRPVYGISFDANACYGPAPFAPVHYSRWLARSPGTLYVVKFVPLAK